MRPFAGFGPDIDGHRVAGNHTKLVRKCLRQFSKGWQAAPVALDRDQPRPGAQDGAGQAAGTRPNLEGRLVLERSGNGRDPVQQLLVQQEILAERLVRLQPMGGDDVSQRRELGR